MIEPGPAAQLCLRCCSRPLFCLKECGEGGREGRGGEGGRRKEEGRGGGRKELEKIKELKKAGRQKGTRRGVGNYLFQGYCVMMQCAN